MLASALPLLALIHPTAWKALLGGKGCPAEGEHGHSQTKGANNMALWEITTGRDEPCLYVELKGEHEATFDQTMRWWVIEANPHDALALYSSPSPDLGKRTKGDMVAEGTVQEHARHFEGPTG
jgi:hypothetical protein